ncbi:MAG TPA: hypothetical protein PK358_03920 [Spirochaetota bacterium]|nr:hypothetical protein [Spirochaetota bacterium]
MFWKISHNRIVSEIKSVSGTTDPAMRIEKLRKLKNDLEIYKSENQLEPESYTFTARVCYALGISGKGSYTDIYLKESGINLSPESEKFLTEAIKNIKKAIALLDGEKVDVGDIFILARAYSFTGYYSGQDIYELLKEYTGDNGKLSADNARFFSIICINAGNVEEGLAVLQSRGEVEKSKKGELFRAKALMDAKKNTESIIAFQKILKNAEDAEIQKIAYFNLGRIYYSQNLYKESIEQFMASLALGEDSGSRIWIGKNHYAMGYKDRAQAVWTEVLNTDSGNEEVKKLLGMIH